MCNNADAVSWNFPLDTILDIGNIDAPYWMVMSKKLELAPRAGSNQWWKILKIFNSDPTTNRTWDICDLILYLNYFSIAQTSSQSYYHSQ